MNASSPRVRFAPSPTGYVHVGSLRTALYNYLFAKKHGGVFVLRIEDTDRTRFVPGSAENLVDVLLSIGMTYQEGPFPKDAALDLDAVDSREYPELVEVGSYGPYIQSERLDLYRHYADQLVAEGKAYPCFCTPERLEQMRADQMAAKQAPRYDRHCLGLSAEEVQKNIDAGTPHVIRFKVEGGEEVVFDDLVRERVTFRTETIDDQVLMKSDGFPTYHLANVVDDHLMGMTHVIRAEEWLPSTPKHILLYRAFGWETPQFAHLPLLLNPDRSKLSKRQGDVAVEDYLKKGYLKEALLNFVALLGWNPGEGSTQEVFTLNELVEQFDLGHVHKGGAVFDLKKLDWLNAQYIKKLSVDELYTSALPFFEAKELYQTAPTAYHTEAYLKKVLTIEQERLSRLDEVGEQNRFFFGMSPYDSELLRWKQNDNAMTRDALATALGVLEGVSEGEWSREYLQEVLLAAAGEKRGDLLWPLRVALTGAKYSPSPSDVAWVLGKTESLRRIEFAREKLMV